MITCLLATAAVRAVAETPATPTSEAVWATVDDVAITQAQFDSVLARTTRARYYHGAPPENLDAQLRSEVSDQLIERVLLVREAKRLGLQPDEAKLKEQLDRYRTRYEKSPQWQEQGAKALTALGDLLREDDLLGQLERKTRTLLPPDDGQIAAYYRDHPEKFTEPKQNHVSVIVRTVDPTAPAETWNKARAEAAEIVADLRGGAEFAAVAHEKSGDSTAAVGGDMGYLHEGMLSAAAEEAIGKLKVGEISEPVTVLEGVAIFKLDDRREPRLRDLADVRERAASLWQRDQGTEAWAKLRARLRAAAKINIQASKADDANHDANRAGKTP